MKDMYNPQQDWQAEGEPLSIDEATLSIALKRTSTDPLIKLRRHISIKLVWIVSFSLMFLALIVTTDKLYMRILISPLLIVYIVGLVLIYGQYHILDFIDKGQNLKDILQAYHFRIKRIQQYELRVASFVYPISITAGFVYGFTLKRTAEEILTNPKVLTALVATNLILIPICYYLARWMDRKAYGQYLDQLKENIDLLEAA